MKKLFMDAFKLSFKTGLIFPIHNSSLLASKFTPAGTAAQPLIETVTLTPDCCNTTGC